MSNECSAVVPTEHYHHLEQISTTQCSSSTGTVPQQPRRHQQQLLSYPEMNMNDYLNQSKSSVSRSSGRKNFLATPPVISEDGPSYAHRSYLACYPSEFGVSAFAGASASLGPFTQQSHGPSIQQAALLAQRRVSMECAVSIERPAASFTSWQNEQSMPDRCCSLAEEPHFSSIVSEPMIPADCACDALPLERTCSYLESQPSAASEADWSAAVAQSGSPSAGRAQNSSWDATTFMSSSCSRSMQHQQQSMLAGTILRSNSSIRNNGMCNYGCSSGAHTMPSIQHQQQHEVLLAGNSQDLLLRLAASCVSPQQQQQLLQQYMCGNSRGSSSSNATAQHVPATSSSSRPTQQTSPKQFGSSATGNSNASNGLSSPLPRPLPGPVMPQQQQQQQHQSVQQQQLRVIEEELEQLRRLGKQLDRARTAAAPGSAAAALAETAAVKHAAAVKRALAARAALLLTANTPAPAAAAAASEQHIGMQQQQQHSHHYPHGYRPASYPSFPVHRYNPAAAAGGTVGLMSADITRQQQQQQQLVHRCASGPLSVAAQGKLQQLVTVQKMQAALQDELMQLLPMA